MAESEDGPNKGQGSKSQHKEWPHSGYSERQGNQEEITWEKAPGHDWIIEYQFDDGDPEEMSVFGCMTAEKALDEARFSLNGINNMNEGQYEIFAVRRADKL